MPQSPDQPPPTKKRHHEQPRFYLRRFASTDQEHIWTYDKQTGKVRHSSVESTGYENNLYSVTLKDGSRLTGLEDKIAGIEERAAPMFDRLLDGEQLVHQDRYNFASFLAITFVRTNAFRRMYAETRGYKVQAKMYGYATRDDAWNGMMKGYQAEHGTLSDEEKTRLRESVLDPSKFILEVDKDSTLVALEWHDKLAPQFFDMQWTIAQAPHGGYFITSDNPVVAVQPSTVQRHPMRGGFTDRDIQVSFPLSSTTCWIGHWMKGVPARGSLPVKNANDDRAAHAERFLYAAKQDAAIEELAKKYSQTRPTVKVIGFGPERPAKVIVRRSSRRKDK